MNFYPSELFRGAPDEKEAGKGTPDAMPVVEEFDPVIDEMKRWEHLPRAMYEAFFAADGLLNEFAMYWALRERFPLHFTLFKQTACHLPHEANIEQLFSRAGLLSDPNMDPVLLGKLTSITFNRKAYDPPVYARSRSSTSRNSAGTATRRMCRRLLPPRVVQGPAALVLARAAQAQAPGSQPTPLRATPERLLFSRSPTPSPNRCLSPASYSSR